MHIRKIFLLLFITAMVASGAEKRIVVDVEGMTCPLCTMTIKRNLKKQPGVLKAKVILNTKKATITYDDTQIHPEKLLQAIEEVGYHGKIHSVIPETNATQR